MKDRSRLPPVAALSVAVDPAAAHNGYVSGISPMQKGHIRRHLIAFKGRKRCFPSCEGIFGDLRKDRISLSVRGSQKDRFLTQFQRDVAPERDGQGQIRSGREIDPAALGHKVHCRLDCRRIFVYAVTDRAEILDADTAGLRFRLEYNILFTTLILDLSGVLCIRSQFKQREYICVAPENMPASH